MTLMNDAALAPSDDVHLVVIMVHYCYGFCSVAYCYCLLLVSNPRSLHCSVIRSFCCRILNTFHLNKRLILI